MLKVLCCVKQVPDVDQMRMDPETGLLIRAGVPSILNPQDENALSAAMWLKENCSAELTVISMGPPSAEQVLRDCLAVGADRAVLVTDRVFGNADTLATSYTLFTAASSLDSFDLIVCGKETLDGATGQMGPQLAERFDASQLTGVEAILSLDPEKREITADRRTEEGLEQVRATLPCLLTIEKAGFPARHASMKGKIAAKRKQIRFVSSDDLPSLDRSRIGDKGSPTKVPRMFPPTLPEPGLLLEEGSIEANVDKLLELLSEVRA